MGLDDPEQQAVVSSVCFTSCQQWCASRGVSSLPAGAALSLPGSQIAVLWVPLFCALAVALSELLKKLLLDSFELVSRNQSVLLFSLVCFSSSKILVKAMLRKRSFGNPFEVQTRREERSMSAPGNLLMYVCIALPGSAARAE